MKNKDHNTPNTPKNPEKDIKNKDQKSKNQNQIKGQAEILKKHKNEPDSAKKNLDIPGARAARPLTNDRHPDEES